MLIQGLLKTLSWHFKNKLSIQGDACIFLHGEVQRGVGDYNSGEPPVVILDIRAGSGMRLCFHT